MHHHVLRIFQREVERQCRFALLAHDDLERALTAADMDRIWYAAQNILVAVGNVSKLLWPPSPKIPDRAQELRDSLGVSSPSVLEPREFRNHFEHFDERLESWAMSSAHRNLIDSNVSPGPLIAGLASGDYLRNSDTAQHAVTFRGDIYILRPILAAVSGLHEIAFREGHRRP